MPIVLELLEHATDAVVDRQQRFAIATIEVIESVVAVIAEVDSVPAVALVANPPRSVVLGRDPFAAGQETQIHIRVATGVSLGGREIRMNRLVGQIKKERLVGSLLLLQPIDRVIGQVRR